MPLNLAPFATQNTGKQDAIKMFGNLIQNLPGLIRDNRDYQIKKQKFADNDTANKTAFQQLQAMAGELGLDSNIISPPKTDQASDDYVAKGIATLSTAAMNSGKTQEDIVGAATKLSGGGAVPGVQQAQNVLTQTQEAAATEQQAQGPLLRGLTPGAAPQPSGPFGGLIEGQQQAAEQPAAGSVQQQDDPELYTALLNSGMNRVEIRNIATRLTEDENFTSTEGWILVNAHLAAKRKNKEETDKLKLQSKLKREETFAQQVGAAPGEIKIFDNEGNELGFVTQDQIVGGEAALGTGKKIAQPPTEHISRQPGGPGGIAGTKENVKLLKIFKEDTQRALTRLGEIAKYVQNPTSAAGREIAKTQGFTSVEDAQRERTRLNNLIGDNTFKAQQIESRLKIEQQPEAGGEGKAPVEKFTPQHKQIWESINNPQAPGWTQEGADKALAKLKRIYGF